MNLLALPDREAAPRRMHSQAHAPHQQQDALGAIIILLQELAGVLSGISSAQYARQPVGVMPGSIGGHVRHSLDHVHCLINATQNGLIDYDHRQRGTAVETDLAVALNTIALLIKQLEQIPPQAVLQEAVVSLMVSADGPPLVTHAPLAREAAYVASHAIHHNAIIAAMVRTLGGAVPDRFGYAPSTLAHLKDAACVR